MTPIEMYQDAQHHSQHRNRRFSDATAHVSWAAYDAHALRLGWELHKLVNTPEAPAPIDNEGMGLIAMGAHGVSDPGLVQQMAIEIMAWRGHPMPYNLVIVTSGNTPRLPDPGPREVGARQELAAPYGVGAPQWPAFQRGDRVRKRQGSSWQGRIVGEYASSLTPTGYAVESEREPGSVQVYPASALERVNGPEALEEVDLKVQAMLKDEKESKASRDQYVRGVGADGCATCGAGMGEKCKNAAQGLPCTQLGG